MPGRTAGRTAQNPDIADASVLGLHLQLGLAQKLRELVDGRIAAFFQSATDLIHLDMDAVLFGYLFQLSNGAGPADAAGNYDRFNPSPACQAHDLRSQVRVKGVEDEQIRLEDLGVEV